MTQKAWNGLSSSDCIQAERFRTRVPDVVPILTYRAIRRHNRSVDVPPLRIVIICIGLMKRMPHSTTVCRTLLTFALVATGAVHCLADETNFVPSIVGDWWQIASNPNVDPYTTTNQEPVDFGIWQAADGSWQVWSCIRNTSYPGHTRLFHGWEGEDLFDTDWTPTGIKMMSVTSLGEALGGLQAPHVFREGDTYHMLYGTWNFIARATSSDGKSFTRVIQGDGTTKLFGSELSIPRDPMTIKVDGTYYTYYTAHDEEEGFDFLRTSTDLEDWSAPQTVAFGGTASGTGSYSAECPFVYHHAESGDYFLFRTQSYGTHAQTSVYRSSSPTDFGVGEEADEHFVGHLPVAAPEIFDYQGKTYIAALNPGLDGIRIAEFDFVDTNGPPLFSGGGAWHVSERRMNLSASGSFSVDSIADAESLLNMDASDPRIAYDNSFTAGTINFNHTSGQVGHFQEDSALPGGGSGNHIAVRAKGQFHLDTSGHVTFGLTVNDGARLSIDGQELILDNTADAVSDHFATVELDAGRHTLELVYFQHEASAVVEVYAAKSLGTYTEFTGTGAPLSYWGLLEAATSLADFDSDGDVDIADFMCWQRGYGLQGGQASFSDGDANGDGKVDRGDLAILQDQFGMQDPEVSVVQVPAPSAFGLGLQTVMVVWMNTRVPRCH